MPIKLIFVYGTLRRGGASALEHLLTRHCEYFSAGCIQGKLYQVNHYPGFVESDQINDQVYGELYRIASQGEIIRQLDEYEECTEKFPQPHEYIRKKLPVKLINGETLDAWVYVFNRDISHLIAIKCGDYVQHLNNVQNINQ